MFCISRAPSRTGSVTVQLVFKHKNILPKAIYEVLISSGAGNTGIHDVAGNALDGNFNGTVPPGDGLPGGGFIAAISTFHRVVPKGDGYVPPADGIDAPAGSGPGVGDGKRRRVTMTDRNRPVIRQELAHKISTRNPRLGGMKPGRG